MLKRRLRVCDACAIEGIGKTTLYQRLARGEYDSVGEGRLRRITEESIERRRAAFESVRKTNCEQSGASLRRSSALRQAGGALGLHAVSQAFLTRFAGPEKGE